MSEEELKQINKAISDLSDKMNNKLKDLSQSVEKTLDKKQEIAEKKVNENPLAYVAGAFVGGTIVGYMMSRKR
jgi:ElaB/YqjD/DUF883 family membrane-anchored ribosome-binding protein